MRPSRDRRRATGPPSSDDGRDVSQPGPEPVDRRARSVGPRRPAGHDHAGGLPRGRHPGRVGGCPRPAPLRRERDHFRRRRAAGRPVGRDPHGRAGGRDGHLRLRRPPAGLLPAGGAVGGDGAAHRGGRPARAGGGAARRARGAGDPSGADHAGAGAVRRLQRPAPFGPAFRQVAVAVPRPARRRRPDADPGVSGVDARLAEDDGQRGGPAAAAGRGDRLLAGTGADHRPGALERAACECYGVWPALRLKALPA